MSVQPKMISPLKISLRSDYQIGVGRHKGYEIIPYTPYSVNKYFPNSKISLNPPPKGNVDNIYLQDLRPYQKDIVKTLINRKSSANFSEPRTGKTPVALRLFKAKGLNKILIVAPASSLYQWKGEFHRWFNKRAEVITGALTAKARMMILNQWGIEVTAIIVSYDSLKLVKRNGEMTGLLPSIKKHQIDGIIVDEAHKIRNHRTAQAKALFALKDIPNKHVLTGTPAHGRLHDMYSILHFLYPDIFTGYWRFIDYYFNKHTQFTHAREFVVIDGLKNDLELPQFLDRISVMYKRKDIMQWLPEKTIEKILLPLTRKQKKYITELEQEYETEHIMVENILTQLIRIRQIANSPELLELDKNSPKIEWLKQYIEDYPEKSIIIFSSFTSFLTLISEKLKIPHLIIGATPLKKRNELREQFQAGKIKHLLINTQAGKEALTLDTAEVTVFLDIYPPYGDIEQAENRFTATTQAKKDKEHTIIHVMMDECYDKTLFELIEQRASETQIINDYKAHLENRKR